MKFLSLLAVCASMFSGSLCAEPPPPGCHCTNCQCQPGADCGCLRGEGCHCSANHHCGMQNPQLPADPGVQYKKMPPQQNMRAPQQRPLNQ